MNLSSLIPLNYLIMSLTILFQVPWECFWLVLVLGAPLFPICRLLRLRVDTSYRILYYNLRRNWRPGTRKKTKQSCLVFCFFSCEWCLCRPSGRRRRVKHDWRQPLPPPIALIDDGRQRSIGLVEPTNGPLASDSEIWAASTNNNRRCQNIIKTGWEAELSMKPLLTRIG